MNSLLLLALSLAAPAKETDVRQQGVVKAHVWAASAGIQGAQIALRGVTALTNDATAFDASTARALLRDAKSDLAMARTHAQKLKSVGTGNAPQNQQKLDGDLGATVTLLGKIDQTIAKGVSPKNNYTQADNTMLGGAASDRGLPPGKGDDVTKKSNRGQRGGTEEVKSLRDDLKAAWDKLDKAQDDLKKVAGDADTTIKLPEP
jgi:hypothetical protein